MSDSLIGLKLALFCSYLVTTQAMSYLYSAGEFAKISGFALNATSDSYSLAVYFGSQLQKLSLLVDTNSKWSFVFDKYCIKEGVCGKGDAYDPRLSSTFEGTSQ